MRGILRKIDSYLIGLFLEIFTIIALLIFNKEGNIETLNFIMLCITFFTVMITYTGGIVVGLILTSVIIFLYTSYIFYINLVMDIDISYISYVWMVSIPIIAFTSGKLSNNILLLQETNKNLREEYENLVTIDKQTGLGNRRLFYMNLDREMSKCKRHKNPCTLMLIKLPYYKEIKKIIGENKTNKLIKDIRDVIINSTRNEDERYTIENDTLAIIMPNTDINGADIVRNRIKDSINNLNLKLKQEKNYVNIDTKVAILEYKEDIKTAIEFKVLAQEELQYDV
ncbi:GGDEF domain-containing protein [Romboutsia sp.]|uniref:GGDEF domain-containing protein n=1 Tax=Romboutsia sp. TaxID=1965302 RepID=UPI002BB42C86|nr:GGDEF domain-containing protein [Romboutsia sp.]HSQ89020.1 GGDEF domain-containing protein [Romboutsia sp.]